MTSCLMMVLMKNAKFAIILAFPAVNLSNAPNVQATELDLVKLIIHAIVQ